jgi:hypothetical protein
VPFWKIGEFGLKNTFTFTFLVLQQYIFVIVTPVDPKHIFTVPVHNVGTPTFHRYTESYLEDSSTALLRLAAN